MTADLYIQQRSNGALEASPAAVTFAGYELGVPQTRTLQLVNISDCPQRYTLVPPTAPEFSVRLRKRVRGSVRGLPTCTRGGVPACS